MNKYKINLTLAVFIEAESDEEAQRKWEDMSLGFRCPDTGREYDADIWEADIRKVG